VREIWRASWRGGTRGNVSWKAILVHCYGTNSDIFWSWHIVNLQL
jgi:hypothetical protein